MLLLLQCALSRPRSLHATFEAELMGMLLESMHALIHMRPYAIFDVQSFMWWHANELDHPLKPLMVFQSLRPVEALKFLATDIDGNVRVTMLEHAYLGTNRVYNLVSMSKRMGKRTCKWKPSNFITCTHVETNNKRTNFHT